MLKPQTILKGLPKLALSTSSGSGAIKKTALYDLHVSNAGKMVGFSGFNLPIQYGNESITESHLHTRSKCALFDVSHMLQTEIRGKNRIELAERLCTTDVKGMNENSSSLSLFTHPETGGILDDLIITKCEDHLYIVSNAGRREHDSQLMLDEQAKLRAEGKEVDVIFLQPEEQSLIALQGPLASITLQSLVQVDLSKLAFMRTCQTRIKDVAVRVTRCGYTGEDGFEISAPSTNVSDIAELLLQSNQDLKLAGLGARDTLRLEAGLCLYGNDIDETTTPVSAGLMWTIGKARRSAADFPGANIILAEAKKGASQKRIGLMNENKKDPPVRNGCSVEYEGTQVGRITSGSPSPSLGVNISMGYVDSKLSHPGTKLTVKVRNTSVPVVVSKMPFVPSKYYFPNKG